MDQAASNTRARPTLLPLHTASQILSISTRTLRVLIEKGAIPVIRVSPRRVAIHPNDLDAYIAQQRQ